MNSPAAAIAWELWRRNRWALATIVVGVPALALLHLIAGGLGESTRVFELLLFLFAITSLFWNFCYVEVDARGRHAGFPSRMFTLPLRTATLAGLPMIYGALAVGTFYWLWTVLIYPSWGLNVPVTWTRIHILTLVAMTFSLQAIVWSFYRFPWIRLASVIVALVGLGMLGLVSPAQDFAKMSERAVVSAIAVVALVAFAGGISGVARDRRGEWDGWTRRFLDRVLSALPGRRHPFSSGSDAQVWFEWRGKGLFLSAILALPIICSMVLWPLPTMLHFDASMSALAYVNLPIVALCTAWFVGMTLSKTDYWSRESELSPFITARPMSCADIVTAKVKTAAIVLFIAGVAFVVFAVPAFNVVHWLTKDPDLLVPSWSQFTKQNPELLLKITNPIVALTAFMIIWMGMIDGLSLGLLGKKHSTIRSIARTILFLGVIIFVQWFTRRPGGLSTLLSWLPWLAALTIAWKVGSTTWYFSKARGLFSQRQALAGAALWLATVACIGATARLLWTDFPPLNRVVLFAAAFLIPGAALARCVAHVYRQRHR